MGCSCGRRRIDNICQLDNTAPLGKGAFATVWRGTLKPKYARKYERPQVAVKAMTKSDLRSKSVTYKEVRDEVDLMRECTGQAALVQLYEFIASRNAYYIVMECCDGGNLTGLVSSQHLEDRKQAKLVMQLLQGIFFLHTKRICHRDIKPDNVFLVLLDGGDHAAKLGDLGVSVRIVEGKLITQKVGTPAFMAPEVHLLPSQSKGYSLPVDLWAVGATLVFLFANEYAFVGDDGRLMKDQILSGDIPLWDMTSFKGFFQFAREIVGVARPSPPAAGKDLVRKLLAPRMEERLDAQQGLMHAWLDPNFKEVELLGRASADMTEAVTQLQAAMTEQWQSLASIIGRATTSTSNAEETGDSRV